MAKKKSATGRRRKKSNTTTQIDGAKRSKTEEEKHPPEYRNGILHGLRVILGKMDDKELLAVMGYVSTMEAKQKSTTSQTVTATATEDATAIATATVNSPAEPTATVPPSPPEDPSLIELNSQSRPKPHNIVTIDPRCFHCDGKTELAATKQKNKSVNSIVNAIVQNNLTLQQRAFALKQAMVHPDVRALAKSAGLIDDQEFIKKNYILNNMKKVVSLAQETTKRNARPNDDKRSLLQSVVLSSIPSTQQTMDAKEQQLTLPSSTEIAKLLGFNPRTFDQIKQKVQYKRDLLEHDSNGFLQTGTLFSQVVKRKGWTKINKDLEEKVISFIENHPNVVQSPIMNDFVLVKDKEDPTIVNKVPKLLLKVSI